MVVSQSDTIEIGGKLIDRTLVYRYLKVQFADMGASGIYDPEQSEQIEEKWGSIDEYRQSLHDEIYRQAGFDPEVDLRSEGKVEKFQKALDEFVEDMQNFRELNETEMKEF